MLVMFWAALLGLLFVVFWFPLKHLGSKKHQITILVAVLGIGGGSSFWLYTQYGSYASVLEQAAIERVDRTLVVALSDPELDKNRLEALFNSLSGTLSESPAGMARLGELCLQVGWLDKARDCFTLATQLAPNNVNYQVQSVYTQSLRHQGKLPSDVLEQALALEAALPQHYPLQNVLALHYYVSANYHQAVCHWRTILMEDTDLTTERVQILEKAIDKCQVQIAAQSTHRFAVSLDLAGAHKADLKPDDWVFVAVRATEAQLPPLLVTRLRVGDLPKVITLDNRQAMIELPDFNVHRSVEVIAKVGDNSPLSPQGKPYRVSSGPIDVQPGEIAVSLLL